MSGAWFNIPMTPHSILILQIVRTLYCTSAFVHVKWPIVKKKKRNNEKEMKEKESMGRNSMVALDLN